MITRSDDPSTEEWRIGVGGLTVLGTLAGQRMAIDPNTMEMLGAGLPRGWERKNLQMVVETKMVNGSLGGSRVVAVQTW